jgi:hypothetical protein
MRLHPREPKVQEAGIDLSRAVSRVCQEHDLTYNEIVQLLSSEITSRLKYAIRYERHGNFSDEGGLDFGEDYEGFERLGKELHNTGKVCLGFDTDLHYLIRVAEEAGAEPSELSVTYTIDDDGVHLEKTEEEIEDD